MDFLSDNTEVIRMKRNYERFLREEDSITFGSTRHNLLPDFEETPVKSVKLTSGTSSKRPFTSVSPDNNNESSELMKQLASRDLDINVLKANLTRMECSLSSMEISARAARIEHDNDVMKLKAERDREATKVTEMRSKLVYVMEKEKSSRDEIHRLEEKLQRQKNDFEKELLAVKKEKMDAQEVNSTALETESELHGQILSHRREISDLQLQLAESQAELEVRKRLQVENSDQKCEIEKLKTDLQEIKHKNKILEQKLEDHESNLVITRALKSDLDLVPSMKSELEMLRLDNEQLRYNEQNTLLLEEEVRSLKKKLELFTSNQEHVTLLEIENEELQGRLQRWEAADTSGSRRPQSPCSLSRRIHELEISQASMMVSQGELQTNLNSTQRKLDQAFAENRRLVAELAAEKNTMSLSSDQTKHLRRKLLLVTRERDSYKGLLDSYENEVTINFDAEKKAQIQRMEAIVQGYKEENSELETEIKTLRERLAQTQTQGFQLQKQLDTVNSSFQQSPDNEDKELVIQLREQLSEMEKNYTKAQQERDILEARIEQRHLQGDYDPSKIKILHLTMNPCTAAQKVRCEELEKLKEDNEKLRKRNKILEENGGEVENLTMQVMEKMQHPSPSKEVEEMKAQLQQEEMRNKRLMEVFKKTSQEFRDVCYQLTGYKIDIHSSKQYRVTSMYAESPRDYFLFQQSSQGEIEMLQTDFSMTVQQSMELYLQRQNSIPMFLSHITMELFSRQTMCLG